MLFAHRLFLLLLSYDIFNNKPFNFHLQYVNIYGFVIIMK